MLTATTIDDQYSTKNSNQCTPCQCDACILFRPFEIAIFCVPDSSRAAAATPGSAAVQQQQPHPEWQLRQASVFASLLQPSASSKSEISASEAFSSEQDAFAADALADGVVVGACKIMVRMQYR
jgi:hypothetical protein